MKEKKGEEKQFIIIIHYFEQNDQYRIESLPVITGGLKKVPHPLIARNVPTLSPISNN